jgi:hypothetical protein
MPSKAPLSGSRRKLLTLPPGPSLARLFTTRTVSVTGSTSIPYEVAPLREKMASKPTGTAVVVLRSIR